MCRNFRSIEWHQKHATKSRETIPFREHNINWWAYAENFFEIFGWNEDLVHLLLVDNNITFDGIK
jgi:hypothetical protein